ncbi:unnamed protein product [Caenorhabditis auriculariae]|uniref:Uncharacterized protein n=1 Tax=Caenorhabditis auriculariae TaxID=2777116 RepID=A0A8S1HWD9_9PELO|nr:unnamed protein product [Caenorhabditis auriculariae]
MTRLEDHYRRSPRLAPIMHAVDACSETGEELYPTDDDLCAVPVPSSTSLETIKTELSLDVERPPQETVGAEGGAQMDLVEAAPFFEDS